MILIILILVIILVIIIVYKSWRCSNRNINEAFDPENDNGINDQTVVTTSNGNDTTFGDVLSGNGNDMKENCPNSNEEYLDQLDGYLNSYIDENYRILQMMNNRDNIFNLPVYPDNKYSIDNAGEMKDIYIQIILSAFDESLERREVSRENDNTEIELISNEEFFQNKVNEIISPLRKIFNSNIINNENIYKTIENNIIEYSTNNISQEERERLIRTVMDKLILINMVYNDFIKDISNIPICVYNAIDGEIETKERISNLINRYYTNMSQEI